MQGLARHGLGHSAARRCTLKGSDLVRQRPLHLAPEAHLREPMDGRGETRRLVRHHIP